MTFGAMRLRYSINILATWEGISKANSRSVFHLARGQFQARGRARRFAHEQVHVEGKRRKVLQPYRHVGKDGHRERSLRLDEGPEIRLGIPFHFGPEATRKIEQAPQYCGIIKLAQDAFILVSQAPRSASEPCRRAVLVRQAPRHQPLPTDGQSRRAFWRGRG